MPTRRTTRLSALVLAELSRLASREKELEGLLVTFTAVEVAPDLRNAFVYVSTLNENTDEEWLLNRLHRLASEWQHEIGSRLKIKYTPRLNFRFDHHLKRGDRVMEILHELEEEDSQ